MKYILLWIQGLFEYLFSFIAWIIFAPYYKAVYANMLREEFKKERLNKKQSQEPKKLGGE